MNGFIFKDRQDAGEKLAQVLRTSYLENPVIFGLTRGGIIPAAVVARELQVPLEALPVKKIGSPFDPELAIGAVAPKNTVVYEHDFLERSQITAAELEGLVAGASELLASTEKMFRNNSYPNLSRKTAVIIDDGIATGATAMASIRFVKKLKPKKIIVAVPVCANEVLPKIKKEAGEVVCLSSPDFFPAVGLYYQSFPQVTDSEVIAILTR